MSPSGNFRYTTLVFIGLFSFRHGILAVFHKITPRGEHPFPPRMIQENGGRVGVACVQVFRDAIAVVAIPRPFFADAFHAVHSIQQFVQGGELAVFGRKRMVAGIRPAVSLGEVFGVFQRIDMTLDNGQANIRLAEGNGEVRGNACSFHRVWVFTLYFHSKLVATPLACSQ